MSPKSVATFSVRARAPAGCIPPVVLSASGLYPAGGTERQRVVSRRCKTVISELVFSTPVIIKPVTWVVTYPTRQILSWGPKASSLIIRCTLTLYCTLYSVFAQALQNVESTIAELGGIFQQLATMVAEQGELAVRIDENIDETLSNVEMAQTHLLKCAPRD
eukprot:1195675-Prorocentrum_minimum.AAC.8